MKFVTTEFTVELIDGNIISQKVNDDCINLTLEGVDETVEKINDLINSDSRDYHELESIDGIVQ